MSVYVTQSYLTLTLAAGTSLAGATVTRILYKKPSGTKGFWAASVDGTNLTYAVQNNDIDQHGLWSFQAYAEIGGRKAFGNVATQEFEININA